MAEVIFKKGLIENLPSTAGQDELLFAEDVGRLFKGNGADKPLTEFSTLVNGFANLEDLRLKNPALKNKLYLTDDSKMYYYSGLDYMLISCGTGSGEVDLSGYVTLETFNAHLSTKHFTQLEIETIVNQKVAGITTPDTSQFATKKELTAHTSTKHHTDTEINSMIDSKLVEFGLDITQYVTNQDLSLGLDLILAALV